MSKEKFKNILLAFMCDYDNNKWSNEDVYNKYAVILNQMCEMRLSDSDKDQKIKDLETKLAKTQNELSAKVEYIHELVEVKDDYKQQLAEKEKEIEKYTNCNMIVVGGRSSGKTQYIKMKIAEIQNIKAIEQLEKLKRPFEHRLNNKLFSLEYRQTIREFFNNIDQQIKSLKGDK